VDLERIEVLRGPQGHLYGSGSMAGTIKLVTKKPRLDVFEAETSASVSNIRDGGTGYEMDGLVNIPLSERSAVRVSGYYEQRAGYIDHLDIDVAGNPTGQNIEDVNEMTASGGRAVLRLEATQDFRIDASVMYSKRELDSTELYSIPASSFTYVGHFPLPRFDEFTLVSAGFEWDIGPVQIVSTTSYFDSESNMTSDITDTTGALLLPLEPRVEWVYGPYANFNEELTHETRVLSTHEGPFQYVAGVFYTDREEVSTTTMPAVPGKTSLGGSPWLPGQPVFRNISPRLRKEQALFGEVSYRFSDQWTVAAGLRYFDFEFETVDDFIGTSLLVPNNARVTRGSAAEDGVVPKVRVEYRPHEDRLFYAAASEGFRMGGANFPIPTNIPACAAEVEAVFGTPSVPAGFESDSLWNYEVGAKATALGGALQLSTAVFYIDWKDIQIPTGSLCNFSGSVFNVGSARSQGVELEMQVAPTDDISLGISASYIDAQLMEDFQAAGATRAPFATKGDPIPNIPEWTAALLGEYRFPVLERWDGFLRGDLQYTDSRTADIRGYGTKDAFAQGNLRLGMRNGALEWTLFVENVTNERPSLLGVPQPPGQSNIAGYLNDLTLVPRTYGIGVRWKL
jgi:outer membrane receptor protein involved in Fe transport